MAVTPYQDDYQRSHARLPPRLGLIGTLTLCAAAMMAHLSPAQLQPAAAGEIKANPQVLQRHLGV